MKPLTPSETFSLMAAHGWLELGNPEEAEKELNAISRPNRSRPEVLKVRWSLCHAQENWAAGVEVGRALIEAEPADSFGWINCAYALRRAPGGGVQAAYDALRPALERLEDIELITFNLACYACQLGRLDEGRDWLARAFAEAKRRGRLVERRRQARLEEDLRPLWGELGTPPL